MTSEVLGFWFHQLKSYCSKPVTIQTYSLALVPQLSEVALNPPAWAWVELNIVWGEQHVPNPETWLTNKSCWSRNNLAYSENARRGEVSPLPIHGNSPDGHAKWMREWKRGDKTQVYKGNLDFSHLYTIILTLSSLFFSKSIKPCLTLALKCRSNYQRRSDTINGVLLCS